MGGGTIHQFVRQYEDPFMSALEKNFHLGLKTKFEKPRHNLT